MTENTDTLTPARSLWKVVGHKPGSEDILLFSDGNRELSESVIPQYETQGYESVRLIEPTHPAPPPPEKLPDPPDPLGMSPELRAELDRRIALVAFPQWEWRDDDKVTHRVDYEDGYHYSDWTMAERSLEIEVTVQRSDGSERKWVELEGDAAEDFWRRVMGG